MKKDSLESIDRDIKRLQEQMRDKAHASQVGGADSTKGLQKLTELYAKRRRLLRSII
jgi:hypothetical protein